MAYTATASGSEDVTGSITFTSVNLGSNTSNKTVGVRTSNTSSTVTVGGSSATLQTCSSNACLYSVATNATSGNIVVSGGTPGAYQTMSIAVYEMIGASAAPAYFDRATNSGSTISITTSANDFLICADWAQTADLPVTWTGATKDVDLDGGSGYYNSSAHSLIVTGSSLSITTSNNYGTAGGECWRYR